MCKASLKGVSLEKVLIVDDSKFSRESIRKALESLGYEVIGEAVDGLDGLQKYADLKPTLIVADIEMPKMNGISMIKELRKEDLDLKIVVVTSIVNAQVLQEVTKQKASAVKKPIKEQRLLNAIKLLDT